MLFDIAHIIALSITWPEAAEPMDKNEENFFRKKDYQKVYVIYLTSLSCKMAKVNDTIRKVLEEERGIETQVNAFLEQMQPSREKFSKDSSTSKCIIAIMSMFELISRFERALFASERHTLDSIERVLNQVNIKQGFVFLDQNFPTQAEVEKIGKLKEIKTLEEKSGFPISYWFQLPYKVADRWNRFWRTIIDIVGKQDGRVASYQHCLSEFKIVDQNQKFRERAEIFASQMSLLKDAMGNASSIAFAYLRLHHCVAGYVLTGSISNPTKSTAYLFMFDDRIILLRTKEKIVKTANLLNVWIVPSAVFARSSRVVDVLSTEYSFAFQPASAAESEGLWKNWRNIASKAPRDFAIFQPVNMSEGAMPFLDWVEINEEM